MKRKPGRARAPTEAEILDAALALLDAGGSAAASIRRIAAAVGVPPNTVYTFFPHEAAVERAVIERLLGELTNPNDKTDPNYGTDRAGWRRGVEGLALDLRRLLVLHPGAVPVLLGRFLDGPNALVLGERLLDLLAAGGLDVASAARGSYVLVVYVLGAVALEVAGVPHVGALPPEEKRIAARRAALADLPVAALPRTAAATPVMAAWVGTEQFVWGLHRVLDGLESQGRRP